MTAPGSSFPILFCSDSPAGRSGYAVQTAIFAPRLKAHGYPLSIFANNLQGEAVNWQGIKVLPRFNDRAGNDLLFQYARRYAEGGLTLTLNDIWSLTPEVLAKTGAVAAWTPVDHVPLQDATKRALIDAGGLAPAPRIIPIAMTRFAQESFAAEGFDAPYVPHAFDGTVYQPRDRKESKELLGVPDGAFVVGIVGDNQGIAPPRKAWPEMLRAFAEFQRKRTDAVLYVHTDMLGVRGGLNLFQIVQNLGIPKSALMVVDPLDYREQAFSQVYMSHFYSAFDVLLHTSYGEGFGVVQIEAGATGTPQIVTDFSAMSEVGYGWHVGGDPWWTALGGWQMRPNVPEIIEALKHAYTQAEGRREKAVLHASQYEATKVMTEHFAPALAELGRRFGL